MKQKPTKTKTKQNKQQQTNRNLLQHRSVLLDSMMLIREEEMCNNDSP